LYDDSRANALRKLDAKALAARVQRARTARDRARDLLRSQKLASKARTGSKRGTSGTANQRSKDKAEVMADILKRFEAHAREVARKEREAARREPAKKAAPRKAAKKATATPTARANPAKPAAAPKRAATAARKKTARAARKRKLTPEQALAQTHALLEAKHAREAEPKPWQDAHGDHAAMGGQPGFQSDGAAKRALRLHAGEARIPAIQGSISTIDRINQGKRDHRGQGDD
ncbi:MAG: hypothetical protein KA124_12555, partial [Luteimonas sp.]|nr:hypothetical protein [Luteimonas sp.]